MMNAENRLTGHLCFGFLLTLVALIFFFFIGPQISRAEQVSSAEQLSAAEQAWLADKGEVVFVSQSVYPPFEFIDTDHSRAGMCIELVRWIATEFGFKAKFIDMPFQEAQQAILSGKADVLTSLFYSEKRNRQFDFTVKTWEVPALIFVRAERPDISDYKDLSGKLIAMQRGDYAAEFLEDKGIEYRLLPTATFPQAVDKVVSGDADAVIGDQQIVLYHLFSHNLTPQIKSVGKPLYVGQNCMGMRKGAVQLQSILNKGIKLARERGVFSSINHKWMGTTYYDRQSHWVERYISLILIVLAGIILFVILVLFWNAQLRRMVLRKTQALTQNEAKLRTLLESIPDMIWLKDRNGVYLFCNQRFESFFGAKESEIIGKTDYDFVDKELADFFLANDQAAIAAGKSCMNEEEVEYADDGHKELLETIKVPMYDRNGELVGVLGIGRDITQRKEMATQFAEAQHIAQLGHWKLDNVTGLLTWSNQLYQIFALPQGDEISYESFLARVHPDDRDFVATAFTDHLEKQQPYDIQYRIITGDQSEKWVREICRTKYDKMGKPLSSLGIIHDVTIQHRQFKLFLSVWNSLPHGIYIVSFEFDLQFINSAIKKSFGPIAGQKCYQYFHQRDTACPWCKNQDVRAGRSVRWEWYSEKNDTYYDLYDMPVTNPDGTISKFGIFLDITKLKKAEVAATAASQAKSIFLSNMSHELRTPLNAILGYAQIFAHDLSLTPKQLRGVKTIQQSGEHLLMLINDILDLSKVEAGKMELVPIRFGLLEFLQGVAEIINVRVAGKGIAFYFEFDPALPIVIEADELRLRQIILNLLSNAVKFTQKGFCRLRVHSQALEHDRNLLTIVIEDSGVGIDLELLQQVFEPFQQIGERLQYAEGSGLGLAISHKLVQLMGGELQLTSPINEHPAAGEGPGTRASFTIEVPVLANAAKIDRGQRNIVGYTVIGEECGRKKILIVDDNRSNRVVLRDTLESLGFITSEAQDGSDVLTACERMRPDAILMDLRMPKMDGLTAQEELKSRQGFASIPVIAITASTSDRKRVRQQSLENGFSGYIEKPYVLNELLELLALLLQIELQYSDDISVPGDVAEIIAPPRHILKHLDDLVQSGDISALAVQGREIALLESGKYQAFAQCLEALAQDFQLIEIEKFIAGYQEV